MDKNKKISVVIPCFNESENVPLVIQQFQKIINNSYKNLEIIVVDGCSTDNTPDVLKTCFKDLDDNHFKLVLMSQRNGYGYDIVHGLSHTTGDILSWTHADLQTDPSDIIKAYELYERSKKESDKVFVKGNRKNRSILGNVFTFGMQIVTFFMLKVYLSDINAQPKLFDRDFYNKFLKNNSPNDFSLDLHAMYMAKKNGYKIQTFQVYFSKRLHGEAKGGDGSWSNRLNLVKRTFKYIKKLRLAYA